MDRIVWARPVFLIITIILLLGMGGHTTSKAQAPECPPGFHWDRLSGVGCVQTDCMDHSNAKYTYTGSCSCNEGYKGCYEPVDSSGIDCLPFCPTSRLVACVALDASCPALAQPPGVEPPGNLVDVSPADPGVPVFTADLIQFLETILAGENAHSLSLGWTAFASLVASVLLGVWIMINLLPGLSLDEIRSTIGRWGAKDTSAGVGTPSAPSKITNIYNSNPANFRQCQDMVYAKLWGQPPPTSKGQDKGLIFEKMKTDGYWQVDQGGMYDPEGLANRLNQLQDGDIIMFGVNGLPLEEGANHYAVVSDGKIYEILNLPRGGELHIVDVKEARSFFGPRTYKSPVDHKKYAPTPYYGYKIFRK